MKHFITASGTIAYEQVEKKSGKTLLLLHGFMEDHHVWDELSVKLEINLIIPDLLGFGESVAHDDFDFSVESQAQAIAELVRHIQPENLYVLGHSMGGYITLELLKLYYPFNAGLLHSTTLPDTAERKKNRDKTIEVLQKDPSIFIREFYWNLFAEGHKEKYTHLVESMKEKAEKIPVENIIATIKGLRDRNDNVNTYKNAMGNKLWIGGKHDKLISFEESKNLSSESNSNYEELSNSGHMGFYEEPEELLQMIKTWLK